MRMVKIMIIIVFVIMMMTRMMKMMTLIVKCEAAARFVCNGSPFIKY